MWILWTVLVLVLLFAITSLLLWAQERRQLGQAPAAVARARAATNPSEIARAAGEALVVPHRGRFPSPATARTVAEAATLLADAAGKLDVPIPELLNPLRRVCERAAGVSGSMRPWIPEAFDEPARKLRSRLKETPDPKEALTLYRAEDLVASQKSWVKTLRSAGLPNEIGLEDAEALVDELLPDAAFAWNATLLLVRARIAQRRKRPPEEIIALTKASVVKGLVMSPEDNAALEEEQLSLLADAYQTAGRVEEANAVKEELTKLWRFGQG